MEREAIQLSQYFSIQNISYKKGAILNSNFDCHKDLCLFEKDALK